MDLELTARGLFLGFTAVDVPEYIVDVSVMDAVRLGPCEFVSNTVDAVATDAAYLGRFMPFVSLVPLVLLVSLVNAIGVDATDEVSLVPREFVVNAVDVDATDAERFFTFVFFYIHK